MNADNFAGLYVGGAMIIMIAWVVFWVSLTLRLTAASPWAFLCLLMAFAPAIAVLFIGIH